MGVSKRALHQMDGMTINGVDNNNLTLAIAGYS